MAEVPAPPVLKVLSVALLEPPCAVPWDAVPELHPSMLRDSIKAEKASESRYPISKKFFIATLLWR
jgi:hypothetical protein